MKKIAHKIDTHFHIIPPYYAELLHKKGIQPGGITVPKWSKEDALALMDKNGIEAAILSLSTPGVHFGDDAEARVQAKRVNEYTAEIVRSEPTRFGFFATLTLPDVEGSLQALDYAYDELHADGVVLLANSRGVYLGDPAFEPLMKALNHRKAVVLVHPGELPGPGVPGIPSFAADFLLDTTRAAVNLVMSGTTDRYPQIKFILAHAGGFVPYAAWRILLPKVQRENKLKQAAFLVAQDAMMNAELDVLRRFYYDTALSSSPTALPSLLSLVGPDHVTFGSDWPFAPSIAVRAFRKELEHYELDDEARWHIERGTAETLFPRFRR